MSWEVHFDIENMLKRIDEIEKAMEDASFWDDNKKSQKYLKENKRLKEAAESYSYLEDELEEVEILMQMSEEDSAEEDKEIEKELGEKLDFSSKKIEEMLIAVLLSGQYDSNNAVLSINAGTGGLDAQDWAQMILRMYIRWAEGRDYKVKLLDLISDKEAGIKTATLLIQGTNAYGYLKSEKGVHRLIRISPFDVSGKRHTSFASVDVTPELDDSIDIQINQSDIKIDTYRASGAGGQHVNTTDSAVRITHLATGVVVQCQNERSQLLNKDVAMKLLMAKLIHLKEEEQKEKIEDLQGSYSQITWGSQIRSYIFQPYKLVKDHRTNTEVSNVDSVMDGNIDSFIREYLKNKK